MTSRVIEEAKQKDGGLDYVGDDDKVLLWAPGFKDVTLVGDFTPEELREIADWVEHKVSTRDEARSLPPGSPRM
jgi:hypothetical protein